MFTVETDWDEIAITVLDEHAYHEDLQCLIYEDIVYVRQWNPDEERYHMISMSPEMFDEFRAAFDQHDGAYRAERPGYEEEEDY